MEIIIGKDTEYKKRPVGVNPLKIKNQENQRNQENQENLLGSVKISLYFFQTIW